MHEIGSEGAAAKCLRVAVLIDSYVQPFWRLKVIEDLEAFPNAKIVAIVKTDLERTEKRSSPGGKGEGCLLYRAYMRIDRKVFQNESDALGAVDIRPSLPSYPMIEARMIPTPAGDLLRESDLEVLRQYDLDVLLDFGWRPLAGPVLRVARYGVWAYRQVDTEILGGSPPSFWEVMEGSAISRCALQLLSERPGDSYSIYSSLALADKWSVTRNRNRSSWYAANFIRRKLRDLCTTGPDVLKPELIDPAVKAYCNGAHQVPNNGKMCLLLARLVARYAAAKVKHKFLFNQFFLAYKIGGGAEDCFSEFTKLIPPKDRLWADPFPLTRGGRHFIFFEELIYRDRKGHLSVLEVDEKGIVGGPHVVLKKPYHLSYPFIFDWQNELYMIPETSKAKTIEVYRCTAFPDRWELHDIVMRDIYAVDTTLAEIDGRWWMFTSIAPEHASDYFELHLFYSNSPLGPWKPHLFNPVKADVRSRPAGRLFYRDGELYRSSQDSYGVAMIISKVERVSPTEFRETETSRILPEWAAGLTGTHTYNTCDGMTVIDGMAPRIKFTISRKSREWTSELSTGLE